MRIVFIGAVKFSEQELNKLVESNQILLESAPWNIQTSILIMLI